MTMPGVWRTIGPAGLLLLLEACLQPGNVPGRVGAVVRVRLVRVPATLAAARIAISGEVEPPLVQRAAVAALAQYPLTARSEPVWRERRQSGSPPTRAFAALAYDAARGSS